MPWDEIAAAMEPRNAAKGEVPMTGEAIKQHLAKIRAHRVKAFRRVPPKLNRTARRQATVGKIGNIVKPPITPAPTPKTAGFANDTAVAKAARAKASAKTPVKSTLLAEVPKSKQKRELQRVRAEAAAAQQLKESASTGKSKRARKPANFQTSDLGTTETGGSLPDAMRLRPSEPKNYAEPSGGEFADIGIKEEQVSDDDDVPLSKKAKLHKESTAKSKRSRLLDDTHELWDQRGHHSSLVDDNVQQRQGQTTKQQRRSSSLSDSQGDGQHILGENAQPAYRLQTPVETSPVHQFFQPPPPMSYNQMGGLMRNNAPPPISDFGGYRRRPSDSSTQLASSPSNETGSQYFSGQSSAYGQGYNNPMAGSGMSSMSSSFSSANGLEDPFMVAQGQGKNNTVGWLGPSSNHTMGGLPTDPYVDHSMLHSAHNQPGFAFGNSTLAMPYQNQGAVTSNSALPARQSQSPTGSDGNFALSSNAVGQNAALQSFEAIQPNNSSSFENSIFASSNAISPNSVAPPSANAQPKPPGTSDSGLVMPNQSITSSNALPKSETDQGKTASFNSNFVTSSNAAISNAATPWFDFGPATIPGVFQGSHVISDDVTPSIEAPQSSCPAQDTSAFQEFEDPATTGLFGTYANDAYMSNFDMDSQCLPSMAGDSDRF